MSERRIIILSIFFIVAIFFNENKFKATFSIRNSFNQASYSVQLIQQMKLYFV